MKTHPQESNRIRKRLKRIWHFIGHHNAFVIALELAISAGIVLALAAPKITNNEQYRSITPKQWRSEVMPSGSYGAGNEQPNSNERLTINNQQSGNRSSIEQHEPVEVISKRTRTSKTHDLGNGKFAWDGSIAPMHYRDAEGNFQDIHTELVPSSRSITGFGNPAWEMIENEYEMFVLGELNSGVPLVRYVSKNTEYWVQFAAHNLQWTNDLDQIAFIATPVTTTTEVSGNEAKWPDAYGMGIDLRFLAGLGRMNKWLDIATPLPAPPQFIIDGGNPVIEFAEILEFHKDLEVWLNGAEWDKKSEVGAATEIEFRSSDGQVQFVFPVATGFDESKLGVPFTGELCLKKQGPNLYVTVRFPWSWLESALYPIHLDTTVAKQVGVGGDDGYRSGATGFDTSQPICDAGDCNGPCHIFARWTGVTISGTINTAYIQVYYAYSTGDPSYLKIYGVDEDNPAAPITYSEFEADPLTSAAIDWDGNWSGGWNTTEELKTIFQELVDSYTISDKAVMCQIRDDGTSGDFSECRSYEWPGNIYGPKLHIEYSEAAAKRRIMIIE